MNTKNNPDVKSSYFKVTDLGIYEIKVRGAVDLPDKVKLVMPKSTFIEAFHKYTASDTAVDTKVETTTAAEADDHSIPIGRRVWFIPAGYTTPFCGHVAGIIVSDFETGAKMYCLISSDGRYFFSNDVKVLDKVATSKEAAMYFN